VSANAIGDGASKQGYHISTNKLFSWIAGKLSGHNEVVKEYNARVMVFNASTVLLVVAAVSALFFALSSAAVFGAIGYLLRLLTERKLAEYEMPLEPNKVLTSEEQRRKLISKLALKLTEVSEKWERDYITFEGVSLWRNRVSVIEKDEFASPAK
jgi:hypothetical protein